MMTRLTIPLVDDIFVRSLGRSLHEQRRVIECLCGISNVLA